LFHEYINSGFLLPRGSGALLFTGVLEGFGFESRSPRIA